MTSRRIIIFSSWVLVLASAVITVVFIAGASLANANISSERQNLAELESKYGSLRGHYLDLVFGKLGTEAASAGFVALSGARYIEPRTVVGLAASSLPQ